MSDHNNFENGFRLSIIWIIKSSESKKSRDRKQTNKIYFLTHICRENIKSELINTSTAWEIVLQ